jgi:brefeldin A-inhibited guanine nucleotide-exchange protein 3
VEQSELPHFHFNEALLKPFENILNMQNCDTDVQDQIITCCMEIVEAHRTEIRSGWRPLFGTLTTKKLHISSVIIDIFRIFLETENTLVFSNAGLDCILCLLSYLETSTGNYEEDGGIPEVPITPKLTNGTEFLHDVLKFLERCSTILGCLFNMPNTPNLHSTYKIKGISYTHIVDANTQNSMENFQYFGNEHLQSINDQYMISYRSLHIDKDSITKLEELEKSSCGVLKVWFLLIDGLTNALILCPLSHQSPIIQTIFKIFRSLFENPGMNFGFYCVNHLLIPLNQDWLRYINKTQKNWNSVEKNFKHCCCMTTDLVVEFIEKSQYDVTKNKIDLRKLPTSDADYEASKIPIAANLALKQMLLVLIECSVQPQEAISRIGVSCLKHILFTIGYLFNEDQWLTICSAIHRASTINLAPLRQLSFAFYENSNSFYGDIAKLKVAARRDCTLEEINRVYSLSQQVFQLDSQNQRDGTINKPSSEIKIINEDRSYAFLLYPNIDAEGNFVLRIPYRNLVIGLLVSQMLLQLIANILLGGLKCVPNELHSVIYEYNTTTSNEKKPQFNLSYRAKEILYRCLRQYFNCSIEFDYRPGLKFLIQKVSNLDYAANLYKQLTSSFIIIYMSLVDVYLCDIDKLKLSSNDLKYIIESCTTGDGLIKKKEFFVRNLFYLREIWNQVSDLYLKATKIAPIVKRESFANEINIVENKMVEIQEHLENGLMNNYDTDDDVFLPSNCENNDEQNEGKIEKSSSEESVKLFLKDPTEDGTNQCTNPFLSSPIQEQQQQQRENPFNKPPVECRPEQQVSPEIEQQRKLSILKDEQCKKKSLTQLMVASMELLKLLPNESTENIRHLFVNTRITEAFEMVEKTESGFESFKRN